MGAQAQLWVVKITIELPPREASDENELKFFGMVFVHVHSFELAVKELAEPEEADPELRIRHV